MTRVHGDTPDPLTVESRRVLVERPDERVAGWQIVAIEGRDDDGIEPLVPRKVSEMSFHGRLRLG
jgi:hypothetical protein